MPRRKRRNGRRDNGNGENGSDTPMPVSSPGTSNTTGTAQAQTLIREGAVSGSAVPDHHLNAVGVANTTRAFVILDASNGPSVIFRNVIPNSGFTRGWSATGSDPSTNYDPMAATNVANGPETPMFSVTYAAKQFEEHVFPVLQTLFGSGTGARPSADQKEVLRHQAMLLDVHAKIYSVLVINRLAHHFDWARLYPGTPEMPAYMYTVSDRHFADDVGITSFWLPLMKRLQDKIIFPRLIMEQKRMLSPFISNDPAPRLYVPTYHDPMVVDALEIINQCTAQLDWVDQEVTDANNLLANFLPFPGELASPWVVEEPGPDPIRQNAWHNSPTKFIPTFGESPAATDKDAIIFDSVRGDDPDTVIWFTSTTQPTWGEVRLAGILEKGESAPNASVQLGMHTWGKIQMPETPLTFIEYDGSLIDLNDAAWRYTEFAHCRFHSPDVDHGVMTPGQLGARLEGSAIRRLVYNDAMYLFNLQVLRGVAERSMGASLRELKFYIARGIAGEDASR